MNLREDYEFDCVSSHSSYTFTLGIQLYIAGFLSSIMNLIESHQCQYNYSYYMPPKEGTQDPTNEHFLIDEIWKIKLSANLRRNT